MEHECAQIEQFHPFYNFENQELFIIVQTGKAKPETLESQGFPVAGEEGFEPSAYGFGDRRSAS